MNKNNLKFVYLSTCICFVFVMSSFISVFAQEEVQAIKFGDYEVEYDRKVEVSNDQVAYYRNDKLVLSVFDVDNNSKPDLWLRYNEEEYLNLEASDSNGDGEADTFIELDREEAVTNSVAPEFEIKEVTLPLNPNPQQAISPAVKKSAREPYVVGPPPTEDKGFNFPFKWVLAVVLLTGIGAVIYIKKRKDVKK